MDSQNSPSVPRVCQHRDSSFMALRPFFGPWSSRCWEYDTAVFFWAEVNQPHVQLPK